MKTIVAGSRKGCMYRTIARELSDFWGNTTEVVSGCAEGLDTLGEHWAKEHGVPVRRFAADWKKHGRAAGPIRNREMAEYADRAVVIWDGESRGSASMVREAERVGIPVRSVILCKHGATAGCCEFGYPGCACADDWVADGCPGYGGQ